MPTKIVASKPANVSEDHKALADTLSKLTNAEIAAYVNNNVTDLASAKTYLIKLTRVVRTLARRAK